jgi:class 3 adenylate cyclase/tetratricopeptide (TPR) repeat protein
MRFCGHCGAPAADEPSAPGEHEIAEALRSFVAGPVAEKLVEAGGTLPEERRLITALFADVSGFTSLADRLDPEQLLEVIDPVISGLSSVVGRYGGYVEKFAGDALMALFGAPVSHEDDAARALRVALEMHAELARLVRELPHDAELTLHVGVNSGHGIARILGSEARMDYAVLGDSVILAQRLESAAPPGESYVSETTVRLTEADFEFEPIGHLTLKGKADPVPTWRLIGAREERAPLSRPRLIGREAELRVVDDALQRLARGSGGVLAITGEPGIGKSRLVEVATDRAVASGAQHLSARCVSYGAGLAYWPYLDLLWRATRLRADEAPNQTRTRLNAALENAGVPEAAPLFARLLGLPVDDDAVAALEPEAFRRALNEAFIKSLRALAEARPLVLALEDIHWIDASSLELTAEVARLARSAPILLLLVGRPEAREQIWAAVEWPATIEVGPFDRDAISRLAEGILGGMVPTELVAFVERRTSGNPLFVQEMLRALRDEDALAPCGSGWEIREGWDERRLPATIEGVLTARIDLLPRETSTLLQTASVIGRRIGVALLEAVVGSEDLDVPLQQLVHSGFLDRADDGAEHLVIFHHALMQDAAYSRMLRRRRRELHLRVAKVAERLYGSGDHVIDLLARHLYLGGSPKAPDYLVRAGERAKRLYANEEAILHFERTLELRPDDVEVGLELADLHELVGDYDEALCLYREIREKSNDLRAWRGIAAISRKRGEYDEALKVTDQAFTTPALADSDLTALWVEQGWTLSVAGRFDQAIDVLTAALLVARNARTTVVGQLLLQLARAETIKGHFESALEHGFVARAIFEELDDLRGLATTYRIVGDTYRRLNRLDDAAAELRQGLEVAERVGNVEEIGGCLINLGLVEQRRGALDEAIEYDRRAIAEFERFGHASGRAQGYANLAWKLSDAGTYEEALEYCEKALDLAESLGLSITIADVYDTMASIDLGKGEAATAGGRAEDAAALYLELGAAPQAADSLELAARAWDQAGQKERARTSRARAHDLTTQLA